MSTPITTSPQAEALAQRIHEAYQRRALDQFGYPPRAWSVLSTDDKRLRAEAIQEILADGSILLLPACPHPEDAQTLVRREMVICGHCGLPVRLLERISEGAVA